MFSISVLLQLSRIVLVNVTMFCKKKRWLYVVRRSIAQYFSLCRFALLLCLYVTITCNWRVRLHVDKACFNFRWNKWTFSEKMTSKLSEEMSRYRAGPQTPRSPTIHQWRHERRSRTHAWMISLLEWRCYRAQLSTGCGSNASAAWRHDVRHRKNNSTLSTATVSPSYEYENCCVSSDVSYHHKRRSKLKKNTSLSRCEKKLHHWCNWNLIRPI